MKQNKIDLNFPNLNGNTPLHLYLNDNDNYNEEILNFLIKNTNLNIQNYNGNSILHLLSKKQLIKDYDKALKLKILNIFIQNYKGETVYNTYDNKDFLVGLASESFFNGLSEGNLIINWEKECAKVKDTDNQKKINECLQKIKEVIKKENRSIPKTKKIKFDLNSGIILKDCFFSGFPIDTLFGILWLKKKYPKISLVLDFPLSSNDDIEDFYKKMGTNMDFQSDFINSMILWSYQKIYFPEYFDSVINKLLKDKKM